MNTLSLHATITGIWFYFILLWKFRKKTNTVKMERSPCATSRTCETCDNLIKIFGQIYDKIISLISIRKNIISSHRIEWSLFVKPWVIFNHGWLKFVQWFWKRLFLTSLFRYFLQLEKKAWSFMCSMLNSFTQGYFVPSLFEIGLVALKDPTF